MFVFSEVFHRAKTFVGGVKTFKLRPIFLLLSWNETIQESSYKPEGTEGWSYVKMFMTMSYFEDLMIRSTLIQIL